MKWYAKTYIGVFLAFLYLPLMVLVIFSFNESKGRTFTGYTLKWYRELIHNTALLDSLMTTLIVAGISAVVATIMGTAAALGLEKLDSKLKNLVMNFTYIPIINPEIITGVSFMLLFVTARKIVQNFGMDFEFGWATLIIAHITFNIPYVILNVLPKIRQMDNSLVEAAMDLGCNPVQAFMKVVLNEIKPGIIAGFLMALTFSMDDFVVSYFTTGPKHQPLSVMVYAMTKKRISPEINALSTLMFFMILIILIVINIRERKIENKKKIGRIKITNVAAVGIVMILSIFSTCQVSMASSNISNLNDNYYKKYINENIEINVYNWGEYISNGLDGSMDINKEFEKVTGIKVNYSNYETNEAMYSKLKSGANSYDVIFPSDYMVSRLIQEDMLLPIDYNNVPNYKFIDENFRNPQYDIENKYSIPYTWGRVGVIYNKKHLGKKVQSVDELWNTANANKILMFKNSRDAFALALIKLGYDLNTEKPSELKEAAELLKNQKPLVQAYVMDQIFDKLQGGEASIAPYYVGDYLIMKKVNEDLEIFIPQNTNIYYDAICIPKNSKNKEAAEMYINFLNEPQVAAANIEYIMYSSPNKAAVKLLDDETRNNKLLYPDEEELKNTKPFVNLSKDTNLLIDKLWLDVMSQDSKYLDWVMPLFIIFSISVIVFNYWRRRKNRKKIY